MKVFVSYRRSDTPDVSGRIYDELARHFGDQTVFKDVDDIPLGVNFSAFLNDVVQQSSVMLIVIGSEWLDVTDERGRRRLDQPDDFVRIEVKAALERGIPIVPLLVQGAPMPRQGELPEALAALALYNGTRIRPDPDFHWDMGRLIRQLEPYVTAAGAAEADRAAAPLQAPPARETEAQVDPARLAALYTDAQSAYYTGQWQAAIDRLTEIVSLQEEYGRAAEMLEQAQRRQTLSEQYALGDEAYAAARWSEALEHLQAVVTLDADYEDAAIKLQEVKRQGELAELYADARRLHEAARWPAVINVFDEIHEIDPDYADPDDLLPSARAAAEAEARAASLAALYAQGLGHVEAQEWPKAVQCFEQIAQLDPAYRKTKALLARARLEVASQEQAHRLEELYGQARLHVDAQEWTQALRRFEQVTQMEPEYRDTKALLAQVREAIAAATPSIQPTDLPVSRPSAGGPGAQRPAKSGVRSWPVWLWVVVCALALLLVGGGVLGVRYALRPKPVATRVRETDGALMVYVPAGEFWMGSAEDDSGAVDHEKPRHRVWVEAFWIDRTEVTNAQYRQCVDAGACSPPPETSSYTRESYYGNPTYDDYPVVNVTWQQARGYAEWVGGRLPSEAEWEYAARGPEGATYPWGEDPPDEHLLNYNKNLGDTTEVDAYPEGASWCGALDMGGNVWEWTSSLYEGYPYDADDGREDPEAAGARVVRAGAFGRTPRPARCAFRHYDDPALWLRDLGFRVVVTSPG